MARRGRIIALNGAKTVGKTTIAKALAALSDDVVILSFATPLRAMLKAMGVSNHNLNVAKEEPIDGLNQSARQLLCTLGTEWGRQMVSQNIWLWAMEQQVEDVRNKSKRPDDLIIVIDDCRFVNEAEWIYKKGGHLVRLKREGIQYTSDHSSERPLPDDMIDWEFDAGGVQNCVKNIVQNILA
jgi:hypothetical protein